MKIDHIGTPGPWRRGATRITRDQVERVFYAIHRAGADGLATRQAARYGRLVPGGRDWDLATRLLKRWRLARYNKDTMRWVSLVVERS